jgi:hypothetical protein
VTNGISVPRSLTPRTRDAGAFGPSDANEGLRESRARCGPGVPQQLAAVTAASTIAGSTVAKPIASSETAPSAGGAAGRQHGTGEDEDEADGQPERRLAMR